ncbi:MAG: PrsW family glutamic-type intramembrane protease [Pseudomonadota bacterium]
MSEDKENKNTPQAPVPRDYDKASYSELVPIKSTSINILKSPIFYMVMITALATITLFNSRMTLLNSVSEETFVTIGFISIGYLLLMALLMIFLYARTDRPFWVFLIPFAAVVLIMMTPALNLFFFVFREILPGGNDMINSGQFLNSFIGMFFGAGLCEELIKVTPALMMAYVSLKPETFQNQLGDVWYERLRIRGPLDGLMVGLFGGAAFILIETGVQYVPGALRQTYEATGDVGAGLASALLLLMPRTIGGIVGHMAWAGITGYFIGLWVLRPSTGWKIMLYAWVGTSALHAMWNTSSFVPLFMYLSAGLSGAILVACLLKARQLATAGGRTTDTYGSIVVGRDAPPPVSPSGQPPATPPAPPPPTPTNAVPSSPTTSEPSSLRLLFETSTVPVNLGRVNIPGAQASDDIVAEVTSHPTRADVMGLKNLGQTNSWKVVLRDGSEQQIDPGRNIRLAAGVKIYFRDDLMCEVIG